jgi:hypothetical protein
MQDEIFIRPIRSWFKKCLIHQLHPNSIPYRCRKV